MNLYFLGFTDLLLSFCFDGISKKRKNALLSGALLSFCVVCEIFFIQVFRFSWILRRDFVIALYLVSVFATKPFVYTPSYTHNQNIFIWKMLGHIWCTDTNDLLGLSFQLRIQQCALCCCQCCGRVAMSVSGFPCTNGRSFLLQSFRHKKWSTCLHFQASFLVDLPFGCPLRQFKGAPSLPSICICYFPLPALLLTFSPSS